MELESTFYVIGIICMSLITLILIGLIAVAIVIKVKIDHIHNAIESRLQPVKEFARAAEHVVESAKNAFKK